MSETITLTTQDLTIIVEHTEGIKYLVKIKQSVDKDINEIKKMPIVAKSMEEATNIALDKAINYFLRVSMFAKKAGYQLIALKEEQVNK